MAAIVIIACVIIYAFIHAGMRDRGMEARTRRSFRYQRRKARRLGVDPEHVEINPRYRSWGDDEPIGDSHVSDLAFSLGLTAIFLLLMFGGGIAMMALKIPGDWFWLWVGVLLLAVYLIDRHRKASREQP